MNREGGVFCNTPPWDDTCAMRRIYANFDGLDVTFQGHLTSEDQATLEDAKKTAQAEKRDVLAMLGPARIPVLVAETGARGGFAFRFDTGPDGATWFAANTDRAEVYGLRASVKSQAFALYGYQGVRDRLLAFLGDVGAIGPVTNGDRPLERISRVDFCVDFRVDHFQPRPENVVAHSRSLKATEGAKGEVPFSTATRGDRIETLRIGKMPRKQVTIYDKRREANARSKSWWWEVWGLDPEFCADDIWRVELRAGKDELDRWPIKTFADFEARIGDVLSALLAGIRYVVETTDGNVSRWPDSALWQMTRAAVADCLAAYTCDADPAAVRAVFRQQKIDQQLAMIRDLVPALAVSTGLDISEVPALMDLVGNEVTTFAHLRPDEWERKFVRARERLVFLDPPP